MKPEGKYRADFPLLKGSDVAYLDNAATTQKPQQVIDALSRFYSKDNAPVHRGFYALAERATEQYESAREKVRKYLYATDASEIVFTRGTTESINTVVHAWGEKNLKAGDEIVLTEVEHHAQLVPWQQFAKAQGCVLKFIPITADGLIDYSAIPSVITTKTKIVCASAGSNVVGVSTNLEPILARAHEVGAATLVDAAQMAPRVRYNVQKLDCDFFVFSGHKMLGPTGIGVLYVKKARHHELQPFILGGSMVLSVDWDNSTWREMPTLLEAGTPPIAQVVGLGAAIDYLERVDFGWLERHEAALSAQLVNGISTLPGVRILGPLDKLREKGHLVSFVVKGMHAHDVAAYLDQFKVAVRAGHHCAQPLHNKLGVPGSVRASFYLYNTEYDVELIVNALQKLFD
ncbi:TPA: cysteine desulfurase [Candidatus Dependentiae bacterium]|nr:cysteine desulfurase [Candidatus Dependentiae bacterium]